MYQRSCFLALFILSLPLCLSNAAHAAESYDNCTGYITAIPTVITTQGTWCLKNDLATALSSGSAIAVNTNNVTIDCNNFKLGGLAAGASTQTFGISADGRQNLTVRNCNIRGFRYGILIDGSPTGGHVIEDNRLDGNTAVGVAVWGDGSVIRRNRILDTGVASGGGSAEGIETIDSVDVLDNTISGITATTGSNGNAVGIAVGSLSGASISGNHIHDLVADGTGAAYGIRVYNNNGEHITIRNNDIVSDTTGTAAGLYCDNAAARAKGNVIGGFTSLMQGCGDAGDNDLTP